MTYNPYGVGGTPTDLGRVPARQARRAYGLRTPNAPDGWAPAYGAKPSYRKPAATVTPEQSAEREAAKLRAAQAALMRELRREHERESAARIAETLAEYAAKNTQAYN